MTFFVLLFISLLFRIRLRLRRGNLVILQRKVGHYRMLNHVVVLLLSSKRLNEWLHRYLPGEQSQAAAVTYAAAADSAYQLKGRSASKLPVSAPGRAALPNATPNLNIGIDLWSASQPITGIPAQGEASPGLALPRGDVVGQLVWTTLAKAYANLQRVIFSMCFSNASTLTTHVFCVLV
jgi:hypothetical protein